MQNKTKFHKKIQNNRKQYSTDHYKTIKHNDKQTKQKNMKRRSFFHITIQK